MDEDQQRLLLRRQGSALAAIAKIVWPDCAAEDFECHTYLTKLITRVGLMVRVTANDAQAWEVVQKHVRSNARLAQLVHRLRAEQRHIEAERDKLALEITRLQDQLMVASFAYEALRNRSAVVSGGYDANGSPC